MNIPLKQYSSGDKEPVFDDDSIIEFKNVSFKYPGSERFALHNLNLTFHGNEKLCIVGVNGSGKTTFIKLITRLYFPTEGEILLNGININEYDYEKYQRIFSPVFQDGNIYATTLGENICMADKYDEKLLNEVCEKVGLSSLVKKLPKKYNAAIFNLVEEDGFLPSDGEAQRMIIARALYHGGKVYLLDEPTAYLDPLAENEIYQQYNAMTANSAAILITHRLAAVQMTDKIAVFKEGEMVEYGTHSELHSLNGLYTKMFDKQAQYYKDNAVEG